MVKSKKGKKKSSGNNHNHNSTSAAGNGSNTNGNGGSATTAASKLALVSSKQQQQNENLDELNWLRECEVRHTATGEPFLQLEYQDDDELILYLQRFLEESAATKDIIDSIYQIWQQTVLGTLLQSSTVWKKENVTAADQRQMKDTLKTARYKINFILHHVTGSMLTHTAKKWTALRQTILDTMCYNTLQLVPRLAESCPHSPTDIRTTIIHFEGKEFLAAVACETWDTLYDFSVPVDGNRLIPILRRCAMLDILDKDWNMLGGWEDILKGLEAKCLTAAPARRLVSDSVLHETTTVLRNARNSMQCKFFSVRFMRYTEDQAPQRWRYYPKCSAPACSHLETPAAPHPYRCAQCWYFHYCSPACQEYCDHILGLHPKFCQDTPRSKAELCQKETKEYLGWNNNTASTNNGATARDAVITCVACGATEGPSRRFKRCQQCQAVSYCGRPCQEWDWRVGGHRQVCVPVSSSSSSDTAASSGGVKAAAAADAEPGVVKDLN